MIALVARRRVEADKALRGYDTLLATLLRTGCTPATAAELSAALDCLVLGSALEHSAPSAPPPLPRRPRLRTRPHPPPRRPHRPPLRRPTTALPLVRGTLRDCVDLAALLTPLWLRSLPP
jgi:hypothetical protein